MPITRSAKKAQRQNVRRRIRNLVKKRALSDIKKKLRIALHSQETGKITDLLRSLYKAVDKAVKTDAIKRGDGDRIKSRAAKRRSRNSKL